METGHTSKAYVLRIKNYCPMKEERFHLEKYELAALPISMNIASADVFLSGFFRPNHPEYFKGGPTGECKTHDCRVFPYYLF